MKYSVCLVTASSAAESRKLAKLLLAKKLCACVNIIKSIDSFFRWEGKIENARESLLVIKTRQNLVPRLIETVRGAHSYAVCEVIALPVIAGNKPYLDWIRASCRGARGKK